MGDGGRTLDGRWVARVADDAVRRSLPDPDVDDADWAEIAVPGHWRSTPAFAAADGPLLYRHRFDAPVPEEGRRSWLRFDGLFYQADVWLDGSYLGDTEGYFAPHTFEIGPALAAGGGHLLAVELACGPEDPDRRRNLTGAYQDPHAVGPDPNPGGIWAPVRVHTTGAVRIASLRVACTEAGPQRAVLDLSAVLDSDGTRRVEVVTDVRRHGGGTVAGTEESHTLAAGANRVRWQVRVDRPALWWPRALGEQVLHDVHVAVDVEGDRSDEEVRTTGLRRVRMQHFTTSVNGERLFLKGIALAPTTPRPGDADPDRVAADVDLAAGAGVDLLRVRGHVAPAALYDRADRAGLLVWQDLPVQARYAGDRRVAVRQARQAVDRLSHHPSVALWCGHEGALEERRPGRRLLARAGRQAVPHVSTSRLDRALRRAIERADPSRPVIGHDGALPHPGWATDSRLSPGWYDDADLPGALARWPALARFVSGLAPQAFPMDTSSVADGSRWPDLDWERMAADHGLDRDRLEQWVPAAGHADLEGWAAATRDHQAATLARAVVELRRRKYRPTGGFCVRLLADPHPAVSRSLAGHDRRPKPALAALADACRPVIVVVDALPDRVPAGRAVDLAVHVVSDLRTLIDDAEVVAEVTWPEGRRTWRWQGQVAPDACALVGRVRFTPDGQGGPIRVEVRLDAPAGAGTDRVVSVTTARLDPA